MGKAGTALGIILLATLSLSSEGLGQASGPFGAKDIEAITKTSRTNDIRFKRDYKGKPFKATLPVNTISEHFLWSNRYTATFGRGQFSGNVSCDVKDKATIGLMMDWDEGQMVTVSGTIDDTTLGNIDLKDCTLDPSPGTKK
jgi:hypothetical protein